MMQDRHVTVCCVQICKTLLLGHVAVCTAIVAGSRQTLSLTICLWVCVCVCPVLYGKTVHRIQMPFGVVSRTGPGTRQLLGFVDRSVGSGNFRGKYGALHCNHWETFYYWDRNSHCATARLLLGEFLELEARRASKPRVLLAGAAMQYFCHMTVDTLVICCVFLFLLMLSLWYLGIGLHNTRARRVWQLWKWCCNYSTVITIIQFDWSSRSVASTCARCRQVALIFRRFFVACVKIYLLAWFFIWYSVHCEPKKGGSTFSIITLEKHARFL